MSFRTLFFGIANSFLLLCLCHGAGAQSNTHITAIFANNGEDKITQDELRASKNPTSVYNSVWNGTTISQFGARNEVVAFNLVLEAANSTATNVTVCFNTLIGPGGSVIHAAPASGDAVFD